jgi:hypothetical protein
MSELWQAVPDNHPLVEIAQLSRRLIAYGVKMPDGVSPRRPNLYFDNGAGTAIAETGIARPGVARAMLTSVSSDTTPAYAIHGVEKSRDMAVLIDDGIIGLRYPDPAVSHWLLADQILVITSGDNPRNDLRTDITPEHNAGLHDLMVEFLQSAGVDYQPGGQTVIARPEWLAPEAT